MPQAKTKAGNTTQADKFRKAAREAQSDQDEEAFKLRLAKVAKAPPPADHKEPKKKPAK